MESSQCRLRGLRVYQRSPVIYLQVGQSIPRRSSVVNVHAIYQVPVGRRAPGAGHPGALEFTGALAAWEIVDCSTESTWCLFASISTCRYANPACKAARNDNNQAFFLSVVCRKKMLMLLFHLARLNFLIYCGWKADRELIKCLYNCTSTEYLV